MHDTQQQGIPAVGFLVVTFTDEMAAEAAGQPEPDDLAKAETAAKKKKSGKKNRRKNDT